MSLTDAAIAATRFGLGPHFGEMAGIAENPKSWLLGQIGSDVAGHAALRGLESGQQMAATFLSMRQSRDQEDRAAIRQRIGGAYDREMAARLTVAATSRTPFAERLVHFWSNHFTVSCARAPVIGLAGAFEREAIRPHVFGKFEEMVLATARHPAMLFYLDNIQSVGPQSLVGRRRGRGLNENYARELLELHTLGVDGGYTQEDVRELAKILTGWTVARPDQENAGAFRFEFLIHEGGGKRLLGKRYRERGEEEGIEAIRDLAAHPSTARFIATKLARHFIADDPPAGAVARLARTFQQTGGDLAAVSRTLVLLGEPWRNPLAKVKAPNDLMVSTLRAADVTQATDAFTETLRALGQQPFHALSPKGWPDEAEAWIGPQAMLRRIDWAGEVARRLPAGADPRAVAEDLLGPVLSTSTRQEIARAPDAATGFQLAFASPEFQRR